MQNENNEAAYEDSDDDFDEGVENAFRNGIDRGNFQVSIYRNRKVNHASKIVTPQACGATVLYVSFETKYNRLCDKRDDLLTLIFRETWDNIQFLEDLVQGELPRIEVIQYDGETPIVQYDFHPEKVMSYKKCMHAFATNKQEVRMTWVGKRICNIARQE